MKARTIKDSITLTAVHRIDGELVLETDCSTFDQYQALPQVVEYDGRMCGKSGWSSDRNYACYKSGMAIAKGVAK